MSISTPESGLSINMEFFACKLMPAMENHWEVNSTQLEVFMTLNFFIDARMEKIFLNLFSIFLSFYIVRFLGACERYF
jgi:hypothetical protein